MKNDSSIHGYSAAEVAELDRHTIEDLGVDLKQLMEIAGMRSAEALITLAPEAKKIVCLAGPGGNGGDALVCAKFLKLWEYDVSVLLSHTEEKLKPVTKHQLKIWKNFGGEVLDTPPPHCDAIVDGILGYSLSGDPRGKAAELIEWIILRRAQDDTKVLALDCPSGLDATTGEAKNPCVRANHTVMYGVAKKGVVEAHALEYVGAWQVVDIGFPRPVGM